MSAWWSPASPQEGGPGGVHVEAALDPERHDEGPRLVEVHPRFLPLTFKMAAGVPATTATPWSSVPRPVSLERLQHTPTPSRPVHYAGHPGRRPLAPRPQPRQGPGVLDKLLTNATVGANRGRFTAIQKVSADEEFDATPVDCKRHERASGIWPRKLGVSRRIVWRYKDLAEPRKGAGTTAESVLTPYVPCAMGRRAPQRNETGWGDAGAGPRSRWVRPTSVVWSRAQEERRSRSLPRATRSHR